MEEKKLEREIESGMEAAEDRMDQEQVLMKNKHIFNLKLLELKNCLEIYNKIRGLSPYPGAKTSLVSKSGETVSTIFYESEYLVEKHNHNNGKIIHEKGKIKITCKNGYLLIKNLKIEGKRRMDTESLLNGFKIEKYEMVK